MTERMRKFAAFGQLLEEYFEERMLNGMAVSIA
jgi:hypothetical protein